MTTSERHAKLGGGGLTVKQQLLGSPVTAKKGCSMSEMPPWGMRTRPTVRRNTPPSDTRQWGGRQATWIGPTR